LKTNLKTKIRLSAENMWQRDQDPLVFPPEFQNGNNSSLIDAIFHLVEQPRISWALRVTCGSVPVVEWVSPCTKAIYRNACPFIDCGHEVVAEKQPAPVQFIGNFITKGLLRGDVMRLFLRNCLSTDRARDRGEVDGALYIGHGIYGLSEPDLLNGYEDPAVWRLFWEKFLDLWETQLRSRWDPTTESWNPAFTAGELELEFDADEEVEFDPPGAA
jgi:hypothetical protein